VFVAPATSLGSASNRRGLLGLVLVNQLHAPKQPIILGWIRKGLKLPISRKRLCSMQVVTPEAGGPSSSASVASSPLTLATEGIASVQGVVNVAHRLFHEIRSLQFSEVADGKVIPNGASVHPLQELKREYYVHFKKLLEVVQAITERDLTEDVKSEEVIHIIFHCSNNKLKSI